MCPSSGEAASDRGWTTGTTTTEPRTTTKGQAVQKQKHRFEVKGIWVRHGFLKSGWVCTGWARRASRNRCWHFTAKTSTSRSTLRILDTRHQRQTAQEGVYTPVTPRKNLAVTCDHTSYLLIICNVHQVFQRSVAVTSKTYKGAEQIACFQNLRNFIALTLDLPKDVI